MAVRRRYLNRAMHDSKYNKIETYDNVCIYCGNQANVLDHVPPVSCAQLYKSGHIRVPACKSCNKHLYNLDIPRINDRKKYLLEKFLKKYKKHLDMPKWHDDEIDELEGDIKKFVKDGIRIKKAIIKRLSFLSDNETQTNYDITHPVPY